MHIRTRQMINNINIFYRYFLVLDKEEIFNLIEKNIYKVNIEKINNIFINLDDIISFISQHLNESWEFERLDNLEKSILVIGVYDIKYKKISKKIIINESVKIAKMLLTNDNYKYINAILDNL